MAKSLRSKSKRTFRALKRTGDGSTKGVYANAEAARIDRLNLKLMNIKGKRRAEEEAVKLEEEGEKEGESGTIPTANESSQADDDVMEVEIVEGNPKKVSTGGPRNSRREQWKASKGMKKHAKSGTVFGGGRGGGRRKNRR
ncbi:hypothetical protein BT69DRAFT_1279411 [Atractiella rhizophila]|nr:hypothetical protein BT69DRAFT_1279411 [Atractiella rhizophila]